MVRTGWRWPVPTTAHKVSAHPDTANPPRLTHPGDTRSATWWVCRFAILNAFQVATAATFASLAAFGLLTPQLAPHHHATSGLFALAAISYILLLAAPHRRPVRVAAAILPVMAVVARLHTLAFQIEPPQWTGMVVWGYLAFVFVWLAPRLMPPPLTNGERRRWLCGERPSRRG